MNKQIYPALDFNKMKGEDYQFNQIGGLEPAGWTEQDYDQAKGTEEKTFEEQCDDILKALTDHENAWPFKTAVNQRQAPDYYQVITEPMWIERIQENVQKEKYIRREDFKKDVLKIFENARIYNAKDTIFYKFADILQ